MPNKRTPHSANKHSSHKNPAVTWDVTELAKRIHDSAPGKLFGYELESIGEGKAVMSLRVKNRHLQIHNVVHGGVLASLADTAGAMAAYAILPHGTRLATVEMTINYLEAVSGGVILAEARVLRLGRTLAVAECEVKDAQGKLAAKSLLTFAILSAANSQPNSRHKK